MSKYIMISTTFESADNAQKIQDILLNKKLVSCCQLIPITSSYHWKGKIQHSQEILMQMKTKNELFNEVEKIIKKYHEYEIPQIVAYDIVLGSQEYLNWIEEETK